MFRAFSEHVPSVFSACSESVFVCSVGQACGEAAGNLQTDAGAAACWWSELTDISLHRLQDEKRNHSDFMRKSDEFTSLLEQERERSELSTLGPVDQTTSLVLTQTVGVFIQSKTHAFV